MLFDVTDRKSFDDIIGWIKDIRKARGGGDEQNLEKRSSDEVLILVGNKIDKIGQRQVAKEEAIELANKFDVKYYETSCKQGINLYEILCDIIFQASNSNKRESVQVVLLKRQDQAKSSKDKKKKCC